MSQSQPKVLLLPFRRPFHESPVPTTLPAPMQSSICSWPRSILFICCFSKKSFYLNCFVRCKMRHHAHLHTHTQTQPTTRSTRTKCNACEIGISCKHCVHFSHFGRFIYLMRRCVVCRCKCSQTPLSAQPIRKSKMMQFAVGLFKFKIKLKSNSDVMRST